MNNENSYLKIANHYKECFEKHGTTPKGLDWDNQENLNKRYQVMSEIINDNDRDSFPTMLDFGCGYGGFFKYLKESHLKSYKQYAGIDINENLINKARELYPEVPFGLIDIHSEEGWEAFNNPKICQVGYDWIICNGVFTVRRGLSQEEMTNFICSSLEKLWTKTNKGIAFNCMSKILDYERDDLFHVSFDELSMWVYDNLSSKFTIRQDYGLREFTMYVYK